MKPAANMETKPPVVITQPAETTRPKSRMRTRIVLVVAGLVLLCACALSLGLYFGLSKKTPIIETHVYFQENQGGIIPAEVAVTRNEEYFSFENAAVVYDFSTGLTVYRSKRPGEMENGCLVESFNMTERERPKDVKTELQANQVLGTTSLEEFRITNVWLNEEALGPKSQDLCADEEIKFIERIENDVDLADDEHEGDEDPSDLGDVLPPKNRVRRGWFRIRVRVRIRVRLGFRFGKRR